MPKDSIVVIGGSGTGASSGTTSGDNSGFIQDRFLEEPLYDAVGADWKAFGLNPNASYRVKGTGARDGTGDRDSGLDVNGVKYVWDALVNTADGYNKVVTAKRKR